MAGYLFLLNKENPESLELCMKTGIYSTVISKPKGYWGRPHESTIADYLSMKAGDNVYFFMDRRIYGIGILVDINGACKYKNYPLSSTPSSHKYKSIKDGLLFDSGLGSEDLRWLCLFEPYPVFLKDGVDMDELLSSSPEKIRMIRAMQGVSFIKLDDEENKAVMDYIVFKNRNKLIDKRYRFSFNKGKHNKIREKASSSYTLSASEIMDLRVDQNGILGSEYSLECGIIELLSTGATESSILGKWDYISRQVIASPFKPLAYADKMDVFGYRYISGLPDGYNTVSDYLVLELKKGLADSSSVEQTLKYVEWIKQEYANGDYSRIKAFLIAGEFDQSANNILKSSAIRHFTEGGRSPKTATWEDLTLLRYRYDHESKKLLLFNHMP